MTEELDRVVGHIAFIWGKSHSEVLQELEDDTNMLDIRFEIDGENNDVVDVAFCINTVRIKYFIHQFLCVGRTATVTHWDDVEYLLSSIRNDRCFPAISAPDVSLVKYLL
jgi:hypothetical protein